MGVDLEQLCSLDDPLRPWRKSPKRDTIIDIRFIDDWHSFIWSRYIWRVKFWLNLKKHLEMSKKNQTKICGMHFNIIFADTFHSLHKTLHLLWRTVCLYSQVYESVQSLFYPFAFYVYILILCESFSFGSVYLITKWIRTTNVELCKEEPDDIK